MRNLSGYQVTEKLHESSNSLAYRGRRLADDQPVILKMLKQAYPSPEKIAFCVRACFRPALRDAPAPFLSPSFKFT